MATNNVDWSPTYPQPTAAMSAALLATGRTMVAPIPPNVSAVSPIEVLPSLYATFLTQMFGATSGFSVPSSSAGLEIAEFTAKDIADPYATFGVGLTANLPSLPNRFFAVQGAQMPDLVDTSFYFVFNVPKYVPVQQIVVQIGLCTDPNVNNFDNSGNPAVFGVSIAPLVSGVSTVDNSTFASEYLTTTGALPTTASTFYQFIANVGGTFSPGNLHVMRVSRRAGSQLLLDSNRGRLLLIGLIVLSA